MSYAMFCATHGPQMRAPCPECGALHTDPETPAEARASMDALLERDKERLHAALVREANAPRTEQWAACVRSLLLYAGHTDECMERVSMVYGERKVDDCTCGWHANSEAARALLERA